jgi:hypothetical protein
VRRALVAKKYLRTDRGAQPKIQAARLAPSVHAMDADAAQQALLQRMPNALSTSRMSFGGRELLEVRRLRRS